MSLWDEFTDILKGFAKGGIVGAVIESAGAPLIGKALSATAPFAAGKAAIGALGKVGSGIAQGFTNVGGSIGGGPAGIIAQAGAQIAFPKITSGSGLTAAASKSMIDVNTNSLQPKIERYDPLLQAGVIADKKVFSPYIKRPIAAASLLSDPTSPLYDAGQYETGFQLSDVQAAYNRSEKVSLGIALTKSLYNPLLHVTGLSDSVKAQGLDLDKVNLWDDQDIQKNFVDNTLGRYMSGLTDAIVGNVAIQVGVTGAFSALKLGAKAAGFQNTLKLADAATLPKFEKLIDDHITGTTKTVLGSDVTRLAASKDINDILDILEPHSNNPRLANLIVQTEDSQIVRDFMLADKGYGPAIERLAAAKRSDDLWILGDAGKEMQADFIANGVYRPMTVEQRARVANAFDDSIAKNPKHQEIYDAFLRDEPIIGPITAEMAARGIVPGQIDSVPRVFGKNYKPSEPIIGKSIYVTARTRASEFRVGTVTRDYSNVGGMSQHIIGRVGAPTALIKFTTTKMPRGIVTNSGIRPLDAIEEFNAHFDDIKAFQNGKNLIKLSPVESISASDYRKRFIARYLEAQSDSERGVIADELNKRLIQDVARTQGVSRMGQVDAFVDDAMNNMNRHHTDLGKDSYAMDPSGVRIKVDPETQRQIRNSTALLPVGEIEKQIINAKKGVIGKTKDITSSAADFTFELGNRAFSFTQLVRPSYIGKNSIIEPLLVSTLSLGSKVIADNFISYPKSIITDATNKTIKVLNATKNIASPQKRALVNDFKNLSDEYNEAVQMLDNHVAEWIQYFVDAKGVSPATKLSNGEIVKRELRAAERLVRDIEEKLNAAAPEFSATFTEIPSLYNLTRRTQYLDEIVSKQPIQEYTPSVITDTNELILTLNSQRARGFTVENNKLLEDSLVNYSNGSGDYSLVNTVLRGEYKALEKETARVNKIVADLDSLISIAPVLEKPIITFRGLSSDRFSEEYLNGLRNLKPGDTFVEKSFSSTDLKESIGTRFARDKGIVFEITNPAGAKGIFPIGFRTKVTEKFAKGESEWLLPRNTKFRVTEVNGNKIKVTITGVTKPQINSSVQYASAIANAKAQLGTVAGDINTLAPNLNKINTVIAEQYKTLENSIKGFSGLQLSKEAKFSVSSNKIVDTKKSDVFTAIMANGQKIENIPNFSNKQNLGTAYQGEIANTHTRQIEFTGDKTFGQKVNMFNRKGPQDVTDITSPLYFDELAYVVNNYMRGDILINRILAGQSRAELLAWGATRQGRSYSYEFGKNHSDIVSIIDNQIAYVNRYLPSAEAQALASTGEVVAGDLTMALKGAMAEGRIVPIHPLDVNYSTKSSFGQNFADTIDRLTTAAWVKLATPENKIRYAWASTQYKTIATEKLQTLYSQGYEINSSVINGVRQAAVAEVVRELEKTFYSIRRHNRALFTARTLLAFPTASASGIYRYSRLAIKNPGRFSVLVNNYYSLYNTFGVDKNGNPVDNPLDADFFVVPGTKEMGINAGRGLMFSTRATNFAVNFAGPSFVVPLLLGQIYNLHQGNDKIVKKVVNDTIGHLPGYSYEELFPFGVETNPIIQQGKSITPGWWANARKYFFGDDGTIDFTNSLLSQYKYQTILYESGLGPKPTEKSILNATKRNYGFKAAWQFGSLIGSPAYVETKPASIFQDLFNAKADSLVAQGLSRSDAAQAAEDYINLTLKLPKGSISGDVLKQKMASKVIYIPRSQEAVSRIWETHSDLAKKLELADVKLVGLMTADLPLGTDAQVGKFLNDPNRKLPGGDVLNNTIKTPAQLENELEKSRFWKAYTNLKNEYNDAAVKARYSSYLSVPELVDGLREYAKTLGKANQSWGIEYQDGASGNAAVKYSNGMKIVLNDEKYMAEYGSSQFWQSAKALMSYRDDYAKLYKDVPFGSKGIVKKAWIKYLQDTIKDWDPALARLIDTYFMNDTLKETIVQTAKENK